ncbi:hypothetical protein HNP38_001847 [Chryseobacterium defluvii]|uniref:Gliding motility-associated-like protein n=1 Tax=Chryseobacterium defluvii TaxID=160396 RepID=A0A840KAU2_9FLAO|nr:hypothetical protein [Chryseobacterium defluvii]MBB4806551.1 hypothetical protein [Chryseobacterium defluvii]
MKEKHSFRTHRSIVCFIFLLLLLTPCFSYAQDTDGDGILNVNDIDDDNDGIPDAVESPGCFYSQAELKAFILTSSIGLSAGAATNLTDGKDNTRGNLSVAHANYLTSPSEVLTLEFVTPVELTGINIHTVGTASNFNGTFRLEGSNNGSSWTSLNLVGDLLTTTESDYFVNFTVNQNQGKYKFYRVYGTLGSTNTTANVFKDIVLSPLNSSLYPKPSCTNDTDGDGTPNHLDTDSDNDGCLDSFEGGATSSNTLPSGTIGTNGLYNSLETSADSGIVNYNSTYTPVAISNSINKCADTDSDGVDNVTDIDDDNDGSTDHQESPNCFYTPAEAAQYTTTSDFAFTFTGGGGTLDTNLKDNNTATTATFSPAGNVDVTGEAFFELTYNIPVELSAVNVLFGTSGNPFYTTPTPTTSVTRLEGWDGNSWLPLSVTYTPANNTSDTSRSYSVTTNAGRYIKYRIVGVSGLADGANFTDVVPVMASNFNSSNYPKAICTDDTDSDGTVNHLDTDSDGDGCLDSYEAGAANTNVLLSGTVGANGLDDAVESSADSGILNYNSSYTSVALTANVNKCTDTDNDGVSDYNDIDDDNDGATDHQESPNCFYTLAEISQYTTASDFNFTYTGGGGTLDTNLKDGSTATYVTFSPSGATNVTGKTFFEFTYATPVQLSDVSVVMVTGNPFYITSAAVSSVTRLEGWDGNSWLPLSATYNPANNTAVTQTYAVTTNAGKYIKYRIYGISGMADGISISDIVVTMSAFSPTAFPKPTCTNDTDGDGTVNHLDTDSDGDGCLDSFESGATGSNVLLLGTVGTNGLDNAVETAADSGVLNYNSTYVPLALQNNISKCIDSDSDGVNNYDDIDDDNDGSTDHQESPGCFYTQAEASSYTTTSSFGFTFTGGGATLDTNLKDNNTATTATFNPAGNVDVTGRTFFELTYTIPIQLSDVNVVFGASGNPFFAGTAATTSVTRLEGWDGNSWLPLSVTYTPANNTADTSRNYNVSTNAGKYIKYRIVGLSGLADGANFVEVTPVYSTYVPAYYPKPTCTNDTDSDGTVNHLDTDSDGDGCLDSYEAGATNTNALLLGAVGTNGLDNSVESTADSGVLNYNSTYTTVALSNTINKCIDTDTDGVSDLIDIDDDNDGVNDTIESPGCFYTQAEVSSYTTTSSFGFTFTGGGGTLDTNLKDNNAATYAAFSPAGATNVTGRTFFELTYTVPVQLSNLAVVHVTQNPFYVTSPANSSITRLEGWDGNSWQPLSTNYNPASDAAGTVNYAVTTNAGRYIKYRIYGVSGQADGTNFAELVPTFAPFNASYYPKPTCTNDTDSDGTVNHLDTDSDGDGCLDSYESGATTSNALPSGSVGANGLADSVETSVDSGIGNYTSTYDTVALLTTLNACPDSDSDGVGDLKDLDDDNDGVPDATEAPACYYTQAEASAFTVTSDFTWDFVPVAGGALSYVADGNQATYMNLVPAPVLNNNTVLELTFPTAVQLSALDVNLLNTTTNPFFVTNQATSSVTRLEGWNGNAWISLMSANYNPTANGEADMVITYAVNQNAGKYVKYRIFGLSGSMDNTENITDLVPVFTSYNASEYPKSTACTVDTDGDTIINTLDTDSDGDGCLDSYEAGATTSNALPAGSVGTNGLIDTLETSADSGVLNYNSTYTSVALISTLSKCIDTDTDGVNNYTDIDDDNDGIVDHHESPGCFYTQAEASVYTTTSSFGFTFTGGGGTLDTNLKDNNAATYAAFSPAGAVSVTGKTFFELTYPTPVQLSNLAVVHVTQNPFYVTSPAISSITRLEGWDGSAWLPLSTNYNPASDAAGTVNYAVTTNAGRYIKYRIYGVSGLADGTNFAELVPTFTPYHSSNYPKPTCTNDTDSDGTVNHLDTDSDGDGCLDSYEGGATNTNVLLTGAVGANGLADSVETSVDSGIGNYTSTYDTVALLTTLNACPDSDSDGVGDLKDLDDDNDGVPDATEAPACYYTQAEASAFTVTSDFTWDFVPVAGGALSYVADGNQATYMNLVPAPVLNNNTVLELTFPTAVQLSALDVNLLNTTTNPFFVTNQATSSVTRLEGWNGNAWISLMSANYNPTANGEADMVITYAVNQNAGKYVKYRIFGLSGSMDNTENITDLVPVFTSYNASEYPKSTACTVDTDGDTIINTLDTDSDGDGCLDSYEAGATTSNALPAGSVGVNGLIDTLETSADSGVLNYNSTYTSVALISTLSKCIDTDTDGVNNYTDIDDDNDGIVDHHESPGCFYTQAEASVYTTTSSFGFTFTGGGGTLDTNLKDNNAATYAAFSPAGAVSVTGKTFFELTYPTPVQLSNLAVVHVTQNPFYVTSPAISSITRLEGWDGSAWLPLSTNYNPASDAAGTVNYAVTTNAGRYIKYRIYGVSGLADGTNFAELVPTFAPYHSSNYPKPTCTNDTDSDGTVNHLDTDSDGDGCLDSYEGGATNTNVLLTGAVGANGLADSVETSVDSGIGNYSLTYDTIALFASLSGCADSDSDGVGDLKDIDDDNDGVPDAVEAPDCYYTQAEASAFTVVSDYAWDFVPVAGGNVSYVADRNPATYMNLAAAQVLNSNTVLELTFPTAVQLSALDVNLLSTANPFFITSQAVSSVTRLEGWNGNSWVSLMTANYNPVANAEADAIVTYTVNQNEGRYTKYRIFGVSGSMDATDNITDLIPVFTNYNASDYPKTTCTVDTDSDGTINTLDTDSDGDGCLDSYEAGATTSNALPTGSVGLNGLVDTLEITADSGTINYASTYGHYANLSSLNLCTDTDADGVGDLKDVDDDNDGIPDNIEAPDCYYLQEEATAFTLTSPYTFAYASSTANNNNASLVNLTDGNILSVANFSTANTYINNIIFELTFPVYIQLSQLNINLNTTANPFNAGANLKVEGWDGNQWVSVMSSNYVATATEADSQVNLIFNQNIAQYLKYRIVGVSGSNDNTDNMRDIVPVLSTPYNPAAHPKATCTLDTDSDGTINTLDTDSDGDGCLDSYEGGATTSNVLPAGTVGTNGLYNSLETVADDGIINYTSTYATYALKSSITLCGGDYDSDGIADGKDIDDDNDGIPDFVESTNCFYSSDQLLPTLSSVLTFSTGTLANLMDSNPATTATFTGAQLLANKSIFELSFPDAVQIGTITVSMSSTTSFFTASSQAKLQGWNGYTWIDLTVPTAYDATATGNAEIFTPAINMGNYFKYRLYGLGGAANSSANTMQEITYTIINYIASEHPKPTCTEDEDNDGNVNHRDTDSDGDGCFDSYEGGATTVKTKETFTLADGSFGTNGLSDSLESAPDSGVINFLPTYAAYALSAVGNLCIDSDNDDVGDLKDLDDDNDGVPDSVESPECFYSYVEVIQPTQILSDFPITNKDRLSNTIYENGSSGFPDTTPTVGGNFTTAGTSIAGLTIFEIDLVTTAAITRLVIPMDVAGQSFLSAGAIVHLDGWNGINWVNLTGNVTVTSQTTPTDNNTQGQIGTTSIVINALSNTTSYFKYRVLGVTGTTTTNIMQEIVPVFGGYVPGEHPKPTCGSPNLLDTDSDDDNCSDAFESNVTGATPSTSIIPGPYGANGLADSVETAVDSGIINYSQTYDLYANKSQFVKCLDFDADGVPDVLDIDDDNDGILDVIESQHCGGSVFRIGYVAGTVPLNSLTNMQNVTLDPRNFGASGTMKYTVQWVAINPVTKANIIAQNIDMIFIGSSASPCTNAPLPGLPSTDCTAGETATAAQMGAILDWSDDEVDNLVFSVQNAAWFYDFDVNDNNVNSNVKIANGFSLYGTGSNFGEVTTFDQQGTIQNTFSGAGLDVLFNDYYGRSSISRSIPYNDIILSDATQINNSVLPGGAGMSGLNVTNADLATRNLSRIIANTVAYAINIKLPIDCDDDADGIVNRFDLDSDTPDNSPNYLLCPDLSEANVYPPNDGRNSFPQAAGPYGTNGFADHLETAPDSGVAITNYLTNYNTYAIVAASSSNCPDFDKDGIFDKIDLDDDNDGILDTLEGGPDPSNLNSDNDIMYNRIDLDSDNDGISDLLEGGNAAVIAADSGAQVGIIINAESPAQPNGISTVAGSGITPVDSDGDGIMDYLDLDSDNDGIYDVLEGDNNKASNEDADNDGRADGNEADYDGLLSSIDSSTTSGSVAGGAKPLSAIPNTDATDNPDYIDLNSDNDGCSDVTEAGFTDMDGNGRLGNGAVTVNTQGIVISDANGNIFTPNSNAYKTPLDLNGNGVYDFVEALYFSCGPKCIITNPSLTRKIK